MEEPIDLTETVKSPQFKLIVAIAAMDKILRDTEEARVKALNILKKENKLLYYEIISMSTQDKQHLIELDDMAKANQ